jgi:two-component system LytT family response regulator
MKAVIIDDEPKARKLLSTILDEYCPQIGSKFIAEDLPEGIELIKVHKPEIVFVDIEMPQHSGLEILNFLKEEEVTFEIIFTTAYNQYALKAFELSAIAYLLKPLRPQQVQQAVEKVKGRINNFQVSKKLDDLKTNLTAGEFKKIGLVHAKGIKFTALNDIVLFEASGMYTTVFLKNQKEVIVSKPLKNFAELLEDVPYFFRPHRSSLVNLQYLSEFVRVDGTYLVMENGKQVAIAKDKVDLFLKTIDHGI